MRRALAVLAAGAALGAACRVAPAPLTDAQRAAIADTIKQQANLFFEYDRKLDAEGLMSLMTTEPDLVWGENGMLYPSRDSLAAVARGVLGNAREVDGAWEELHVLVLGPDAAAASGRFHFRLVKQDGSSMTIEQATWTGVYQRRNGRWVVVQGNEGYPPPVMTSARRR